MTDPLFPTVTAALNYWRRWQEAMRSGMAINPEPRDSDGGMPVREEILATYLSVDRVVTDTLTGEEKQAVDSMINDPRQRPERKTARSWHRAVSKLGKEMRRRGIVGQEVDLEEQVDQLEVVWGWAGIADLLEVSKQTARRYAGQFGLPVRKVGESEQAPVYLIMTEYEGWLKGGLKTDNLQAFDNEFQKKAERVRRKLTRGARKTETDPV